MNFLTELKRTVSTNRSEDALSKAEKMGKLDIDDWFGTYRARITMGKWGDAEVIIWGSGATPTLALEDAVQRVEEATEKFGKII